MIRSTGGSQPYFDASRSRARKCPWRPFELDELQALRKRWKNGKACGLDMISHEALKALASDEGWQQKFIGPLQRHAVHFCRIPESAERGITILLAKVAKVNDWGDMRPITLSSTLPQILQPADTWTSSMGSGTGETERGTCPPAPTPGTSIPRQGYQCNIAKMDIRKAFASIFQEAMAQQVAVDVGETAHMPCEARAWVTLLHAGQVTISFRDGPSAWEQTNGVRQRSPDSPIAFGRVVSKDLESAILAARCCKPTNGNPPPEDGGSYMDDTYIWSMSRTHLQRMLDELCGRLSPCGLQVHPRKTEIIANMAGGEEFRVSGSRVKSKGLEHIIPVLGSPPLLPR